VERYISAALTLGLSPADLDELTIGMVLDICNERSGEGYTEVDAAGAQDFFCGR